MMLQRFLRVMCSSVLGLTLMQLTPLGFLSSAQAGPEPKVTICHFPPGNPANYQTITVGASAVDAHVDNHNDLIGPCATACDDGKACTIDTLDPNSPERCVHTPLTCNDGSACTTDSCNDATGCVYTPISCGDSNACTADSCDPTRGCVNTTIPGCCLDDQDCDDGVSCTVDRCKTNNKCDNTPIDAACDDMNECTSNVCDPTKGCIDTNLCVPGETCLPQIGCTSSNCNDPIGCCPNQAALDKRQECLNTCIRTPYTACCLVECNNYANCTIPDGVTCSDK